MEVHELIVSVLQKFATFQVLISDDGDWFGALTLKATEVLRLVSGEIICIYSQKEAMARINVVLIIALNLAI